MGSASGTIDISGIVSSGTLAEGKNYYVKLSVPAAAGETYTANNERKFLVVSPKSVAGVNVDETSVLLLPFVFLTVLGIILFRK